MEIIPSTSYAIKKMLKKYLIIYIFFIVTMLISVFIIYNSAVIFLLKNLKEILFNNSLMSEYLFLSTLKIISVLFFGTALLSLSLFLLELYALKTKKIKIILDKDGVSIYNGKLLKKTNWDNFSDIIVTTIYYKLKRGQKNKLVIPNLFNKNIIKEAINDYKNNF